MAFPRISGTFAVCLAALFAFAPASYADSEASFTYSPAQPMTGDVVTLTSTSTGTVTSTDWDLDNDGFCDDASGSVVQHSFPVAGKYGVSVCTNTGESEQKRTITVANRHPLAGFDYSPADPVAGEPVTLTSTSFDFDGPIVGESWALDSPTVFGDGSGMSVTRTWPRAGVYPVSLRVTDRDGATADSTRWIPVHHKTLKLLSPFPVVRLAGRIGKTGTRVSSLVVQAPRGARVSLRCSGRSCPYRRASALAAGNVRFRRLQRFLRAGTVLQVSVTKPGTIGKYSRFRIRRGAAPARVDRCIKAGAKKPVRCPSS
jgi:PKD domain